MHVHIHLHEVDVESRRMAKVESVINLKAGHSGGRARGPSADLTSRGGQEYVPVGEPRVRRHRPLVEGAVQPQPELADEGSAVGVAHDLTGAHLRDCERRVASREWPA